MQPPGVLFEKITIYILAESKFMYYSSQRMVLLISMNINVGMIQELFF